MAGARGGWHNRPVRAPSRPQAIDARSAPSAWSLRSVSLASIAEQQLRRIALELGGKARHARDKPLQIGNEIAELVQGVVGKISDPGAVFLDQPLKLPAGVGEVLGQPVGIAERLRQLVLQPAFFHVALLEIAEQGPKLDNGLIGIVHDLAHFPARLDERSRYRPNILQRVGDSSAVVLVEHVIQAVRRRFEIRHELRKASLYFLQLRPARRDHRVFVSGARHELARLPSSATDLNRSNSVQNISFKKCLGVGLDVDNAGIDLDCDLYLLKIGRIDANIDDPAHWDAIVLNLRTFIQTSY